MYCRSVLQRGPTKHREPGFSRKPSYLRCRCWLTLLPFSDRIPLVRYAVRAALAENQGLACLPLSHPEASLPWKTPDTRHHVFEAQVLPMLNSTFRMESHLRVFGLTNQLNIVFKRQRGWRETPPGNSSKCSPIRGRRWESSLQSESCDAWSAALHQMREGGRRLVQVARLAANRYIL